MGTTGATDEKGAMAKTGATDETGAADEKGAMADTGATDETGAASALSWKGPAIGLLDLDAFFASVEQLDHPEWRGRPVIVGGDAERRGVVSTASYEARRYGVHSAMPAAQARRLCPQAIWTHGHFDRYREVSSQVMAIIVDETPYVEQVSIDEAFFDVTPGRFSRESPTMICQRIQARVAELGVTCSIGIGASKAVAKVASEAEKPRGLTVVPPGTEAQFLAPLPVRALSGVGTATEARLARMGIRTLGQLADAPATELARALGVAGPELKARAAGGGSSHVGERARPTEAKSVSNERTFAKDIRDTQTLVSALEAVCALVGRRMRRKGLTGRTLTVKVKFDATTTRSAQTRLAEPSDDEAAFAPVARKLLRQLWSPGEPVRLVGVGLSGLSERQPYQPGLFDDPKEEARRESLRRLHLATDEVRDRFGDGAVAFGRDIRLGGSTTNTQPQHKEDS